MFLLLLCISLFVCWVFCFFCVVIYLLLILVCCFWLDFVVVVVVFCRVFLLLSFFLLFLVVVVYCLTMIVNRYITNIDVILGFQIIQIYAVYNELKVKKVHWTTS